MSQTGKNIVVSYGVESAFNTPPGASGATQLRLDASPGLSLKRKTILNPEIRSDGLSMMGRLGSQEATGNYSGSAIVGAHDVILEAVMRSTWVAAVTIDQTTMTSITIPTTSTIVAAAGSWITQGLRAGDVFRLTGNATTADDSINLRVKTVTASTITVEGTPLTVNAAADTTFTITVGKKLKNGATPTKRSFYVDQYNQDIDQSEVFGGVKWIGLKITGTPDGMAKLDFTALGASGAVLAAGASSPYFTAPTLPTGTALIFADAKISVGGVDIAIATAFDLTLTIAAKTEPVIGAPVTPDVYDNDATLSGSFSMVRNDLSNVSTFLAETQFALHVLLTSNMAEPKDYISIYVPICKYTAADAPLGNDGAMIETLPFICGKSEGVSGVDDTLLTICTSAA